MVKKLLGTVILSSFLTISGWAATPSPAVIATPPQPKWTELTVQQKTILSPLSSEWDAMEAYRRKKWLGIALRFSAMTPDGQRRVQGQMQEWTKLTPEQRQQAREKFQTVNQLPTEKKVELKQKWEEYSNLPEDERLKLKQQAAVKALPKSGHSATAGAQAMAPAVETVPNSSPAPTEESIKPAQPAANTAQPLIPDTAVRP